MLRALDVRDFVLVERVALEFGAGFGVLTGETGAGKSMLVDAIELLVGGRAEGDLGRAGAERAELSAEFDSKDDALSAWLAEADLQGDPGTVIVRRTLDRSGRSRAFINGHSATLAQLREVGERLVDLHGQHEHQSLLRAGAQRELLDAHAGTQNFLKETSGSTRDRSGEELFRARGRARPGAGLGSRFEETFSGGRRMGEGERRAHAAAAWLEPARRRAVVARGARRSRWGDPGAARSGREPPARALRARQPVESGYRDAGIGRGAGRRGGARVAPLRRARRSRPRRAARGRSAHRSAARRGSPAPRAAGGARRAARGTRGAALRARTLRRPGGAEARSGGGARPLRRGGKETLREAQGCGAEALQGGERRHAAARHGRRALLGDAERNRTVRPWARVHRLRGRLAPEPAASPAGQGCFGRRAFAYQPRHPARRCRLVAGRHAGVRRDRLRDRRRRRRDHR